MPSPSAPEQPINIQLRLAPRGLQKLRRLPRRLWYAMVRFVYSVKMWPLRPMKPERFEALVGFGRHPATKFLTPELEHFRTRDEVLLGVINIDTTDEDFYAGILARDKDGRYRLISNEASIPTLPAARSVLTRLARQALREGPEAFRQGDEKGKKQDLFANLPRKKLHPSFIILRDFVGHSAARGLIEEIMHHYVDVDGNFIEQFQTTGFDSRLWELYLFAYLNEEALLIERPKPAPDFIVSRGEKLKAAIEAVTVNRTQTQGAEDETAANGMSPEKVIDLSMNFMPIKFGSPLYSKLSKRYWELPNAKGLPLVFAIADFHDKASMTWTSTALIRYLYGVHHEFSFNKDGQLVISPLKIEKHVHKDKEIPSGFFFLPESEHVSAVLFSASGTISKFNRLGKIAGFGDKSVRMIRAGTNHRHDPNSALPDQFIVEVDDDYYETWGEGVSIFHNPNAKIPLSPEIFPSAAHHRFENGQIVSTLPEFHPYGSMTYIFVPRSKRTREQVGLEAAMAAEAEKDAKE